MCKEQEAAPRESTSELRIALTCEDQGEKGKESSLHTSKSENLQPSSSRYTVYVHTSKLGIQIRELHGIPVVAGLKGYGVANIETEEDDKEQGSETFQWEPIQCLHEENKDNISQSISTSQSPFDDSSYLHPLIGNPGTCQTEHGGTFTFTSGEWYSIDLEIKMVLECPSVFGKGIRKLWRWKPLCDREELGSKTGLNQFVFGLLKRLGPRARAHFRQHQLDDAVNLLVSDLHVSFFDNEEGDYISLDAESWPEFIFLHHKRIMVDLVLHDGVCGGRNNLVMEASDAIIEEEDTNRNIIEHDEGQDNRNEASAASSGINGGLEEEEREDEGLLSVGVATSDDILQEVDSGKSVLEPNDLSDEKLERGDKSNEMNGMTSVSASEICDATNADTNGSDAASPQGFVSLLPIPSDDSLSGQVIDFVDTTLLHYHSFVLTLFINP